MAGRGTGPLLVPMGKPALPDQPAPPYPEPEPSARWLTRHRRDLALLGLVVVALAFLWGRAARVWFWIDEAIAVGIASHPLSQLHDLLRQDGSPPLYYALLHVWMSVFGSSEAATHLLSLLFALAVVPAALWAGWSLFGRRTGWICAALAAVSPFIERYATETRMYSLVVLLTLLVTATFIHGFVFERRRYLPAFAALLTLLLYTHNWGLLVAGGAGLALLPCLLLAADRRRLVLDAVLTFGAVGLLYAPWVPTLLYQMAHHEQPWARHVGLNEARLDVANLFGGYYAVVALGLAAVASLWITLRWPWSRRSLALVVAGVIPLAVLLAGWGTSVWAVRYLAAFLPPLLLLIAAALADGGRIGVAALVISALLTAPLGVTTPSDLKSNAKDVAQRMSPSLRPGDLVVSPDYSQIPLLSYYFPPGLRYAGTEGLVHDVTVADWRDGLSRMRRSNPDVTLPPLLDRIPVGGQVVLMCPMIGPSIAVVEFHRLVRQRCEEVQAMLSRDPRFRLDLSVSAPSGTDVQLTAWTGQELTRVAS